MKEEASLLLGGGSRAVLFIWRAVGLGVR